MPKSKLKANEIHKRNAGQFLARKDEAVQWFQREDFDPAEFVGLLNSEKELDQARNELEQLSDYCKQEVQKVVHAHHKDFLEASRNIQEVEILVDELRNYVSGSAAVVANLVDVPAFPKQGTPSSPLDGDLARSEVTSSQQAPSTWDSIRSLQAELLQELQVAVAEQEVSLARSLLDAGRDIIAVVDRDAAQLAPQGSIEGIPGWRYAFEGALAAQKAILIEELQRQLLQTNSSTLERRQAAQSLGLIVGPSQATQALLGCHLLRVRAAQQYLLKQHSAAGGDPDGVEYAGGLAQRTFLAIGAAAEDVRAVFPSHNLYSAGVLESSDQHANAAAVRSSASPSSGQAEAVLPSVSALVVQWASDEARHCAALLCRHALTPFVATGMAVGALLCVGLALVFCVALESSHGLALRVAFMEELWPLLEAIVCRHLRRLREEASATSSVDATNAALQAVAGNGAAPGPFPTGGGSADLPGFPGISGRNASGPQPPDATTKFQEQLPVLFLRPDVRSSSSAPAGLTCLHMLVPELKALAEGLAPLASRSAVAVLRQGVQASYETICEKVHASLSRLVSSNTGAATSKDAIAQGSLLAAYVSKSVNSLRMFAESDVQIALESLATVCGPVAPPELLLPSLAPLGELLTKLPEPAPGTAPAQPVPVRQPLKQQHSLGLLDRIRVELHSDEDRRAGGWSSRDAPTQASGAGHTAPAAAATPDAAYLAAAVDAAESPAPRKRESVLPEAGPEKDKREAQVGIHPGARAAGIRETVPEQAGNKSATEANTITQRRRQTLTVLPGAGRQEADDEAGSDAGLKGLGESSDPRRPQLQRRGNLRAGDGVVRPQLEYPSEDGATERAAPCRRDRVALDSTVDGAAMSRGEDEGDAPRPSSRSRSHVQGRYAGHVGSDASFGEDIKERAAPVEVQRRQPERISVQVARVGNLSSTGSHSALWPGGETQVVDEQEACRSEEVPDTSRRGSEAIRRRQGQDRTVRFQQPSTEGQAQAAGGAGASSNNDVEVPARKPQRVRAQEGAMENLRQTSRQNFRTAVRLEEHEGSGDGEPPLARKVRPQMAIWSQPTPQGDNDGEEEGTGSAPPPDQSRAVRRDEGLGGREETADTRKSPGRRRGTRQDFRAPSGENEDEQVMRHASREQVLVEGGTSLASAAREAAARRTYGTASNRNGVSITAAPERARDVPTEGEIKVAAGAGGRKPNRFGVVLSDDDDGLISAPKLRRPRPVDAGLADVAATAPRGVVIEVDSASVQAKEGATSVPAGTSRQDQPSRPGLQEERAIWRNVAATDTNKIWDIGRRRQGSSALSGDSVSVSTTGPQSRATGTEVSAPHDSSGEVRAVGRREPTGKPQTARERLAARMAAKGAAPEGL